MNAKLQFQETVGRGSIWILAPLIIFVVKCCGYRVRDLHRIRKQCRRYFQKHPGPWLICANHLTLIDSVLLIYAIMPLDQVLMRYDIVPWNVPERKNFGIHPLSRLLCYALKCVPVDRMGSRKRVRTTLDNCIGLLDQGRRIMIFPEGTRSRSGRISTTTYPYGVGRLLTAVPDCRVLCLYLRGDHQGTYSRIPGRNEVFTIKAAAFHPRTRYTGLKAQRDYAGQVIAFLAGMEEQYFHEHR